jgi:hypothetical protein
MLGWRFRSAASGWARRAAVLLTSFDLVEYGLRISWPRMRSQERGSISQPAEAAAVRGWRVERVPLG